MDEKMLSREIIEVAISKSKNYTQLLQNLGIKYCNGRTLNEIKNKLEEFGLSVSNFTRLVYERRLSKCKKCGKEIEIHDGCRGNKSFCNQSCSASFNNKKRIVSDDTKRKISAAVLNAFKKSGRIKTRIKEVKICRLCGKNYYGVNKQFCNNSCSNKYKWQNAEYREKLHLAMMKRIENGTHAGWKKRTLEPSYAEKYFIEVLNKRNIKFIREYPIGKYFIDFFLIKEDIALEIDGKQHEFPDRIESDIEKDKLITSEGHKIFRIKWKNPINKSSKIFLYSQIDKFDEFRLNGK